MLYRDARLKVLGGKKIESFWYRNGTRECLLFCYGGLFFCFVDGASWSWAPTKHTLTEEAAKANTNTPVADTVISSARSLSNIFS